jgi:radical SAM superfamily enzyme YgiQ (UPF0313 family)
VSLSRRTVLLLQLPIPPPGPQAVEHNVPLAAGYLKLFARNRGLEKAGYQIDLLPPPLANTLGDRGLVEEILSRQPWMVGFTCYVWNVERSLWIAERLKQQRPELRIVLGGPEITADNHRVLGHPAVDYAVLGEGEQTFAELLEALLRERRGTRSTTKRKAESRKRSTDVQNETPLSAFRFPLFPASLDEVSSPYLEGILDAADEKVMFLETMRGCTFRCKFCYYPKGYDRIHLLSPEKIAASLRHAVERGAHEVVLLDPTLNQRPDFDGFLRLLAQNNPDRQLAFFGELRAEGIDAAKADLLRAANFSEVEIGLQSVDPHAQELMGRKINLQAFERGARAMRDAGIAVRVDLILGLPGDTVDSVRRSIDFLHRSGLYSAVQVFNLSILPGTAFRQEAEALGLKYQPRPPYYVLQTPTLSLEDMYELMEEAQEAFELEYDPAPPPQLDIPEPASGPVAVSRIDLDEKGDSPHLCEAGHRPKVGRGPFRQMGTVPFFGSSTELPPAPRRAQAFTLWLRSADFHARRQAAAQLIRQVLTDNPHTTLDVILEPAAEPERLTTPVLEACLEACHPSATYLDLYYSLHPNRLLGAKRLIALLPGEHRARLGPGWIDQVGRYATIVWRGGDVDKVEEVG